MNLALLLCASLLHVPQSSDEPPTVDAGSTVDRLRVTEFWRGDDTTFGVDACWIGTPERPQLLVSAPEVNGDAGGLYVLDGAEGRSLQSFTLPSKPVSRLGKRLQSVGDVDGDGAGDFVVFGEMLGRSGERYDHAFGVSSATGDVLFAVEGLRSMEPWSADLVTIEAFDFDADGALDFVVQPQGAPGARRAPEAPAGAEASGGLEASSPSESAGRFEVRSGRDGSVLCAFDVGPQPEGMRLWAVHLTLEPGAGLLALVERIPDAGPAWQIERSLLRVARDGSTKALELNLPKRGRVHGFFDLDGDAVGELLMHRMALDVGADQAGSSRSPLDVELLAVDVRDGKVEHVGTLLPLRQQDTMGPRIPQAMGVAAVGGRRVLYTANLCGYRTADLAAFEVGHTEPLWIEPWEKRTQHLGTLLSAPAVVGGEVVAAFSDGALIENGGGKVLLVRLRDGKSVW